MTSATARQLLRFCVVGGIGFAVDGGVLWLLLEGTSLGPYLGRVLSYVAAATATWALHRRFTFPDAHRGDRRRQWALFVAVNTLGAAVNYGAYALLIATAALFAAQPVAAVAVASLAALAVNFTANRHWVFRDAAR